ncbi:MAG: hypothetical protein E7598_06055 [Ruminococcaceae bacterium]|nr:hypothetical protein [Oscillospiraceae bacterium]
MDLKKLYGDACVRLGRELPIYEFLSYVDTCVRTLLCRYQKKLLIGISEYTSPESLNSSIALDGIFYTAVLYFVLGSASGNEKLLEKCDLEAENAYRTLWKKAARGKRRVCDRW